MVKEQPNGISRQLLPGFVRANFGPANSFESANLITSNSIDPSIVKPFDFYSFGERLKAAEARE